ncbi:hypothetical protein BABINDRAFT_14401 [Babjeviella inositovora NRRL Y-12698]|uniref:ornithine decarboxylase n=1 Tax=Babjeviella inositovora NRRL Y-12698 TaxID=984486 RepID=A0A1E3QMD6_9ASCO|nr:uncharacterized protein BABINDRAFT_14401 [Babjeviella inositovora NRRL Y-12698]ODQ78778.1 hypothetical protein BABINDRAFT_14401 [Babjeviella inositovora NRRL Y-12698]
MDFPEVTLISFALLCRLRANQSIAISTATSLKRLISQSTAATTTLGSTSIDTFQPMLSHQAFDSSAVHEALLREKMLTRPDAAIVDELSHLTTAQLKSAKMVSQALWNHTKNIDAATCEADAESSVFVCDLGEVVRMYRKWRAKFPRIRPFYAVKCNPDVKIIQVLHELGCGFDCASKGEIATVLALGVPSTDIIYANPCKQPSFVRYARLVDVSLTTADNVDELRKIARFDPSMGVLIRIATDDENAQCRLSTKFGARMENVPEILHAARDLNICVRGVSFHVGSGASDYSSLGKAVADAKRVFAMAYAYGFRSLDVLDVGGGFTPEDSQIDEAAKVLNNALEVYFPAQLLGPADACVRNVRVISEPGRFFVANAFTLAANVIAKRSTADTPDMLYINDGVYGNLNCILYDHQHPQAYVLTHEGGSKYRYGEHLLSGNAEHVVSIWGPTCDGLDCVASEASLSQLVEVGDWLYFPQLGAYTSAATTQFNGFASDTKVIYVASEV